MEHEEVSQLIKQQKFAEAVHLLNQTIEEDPEDPIGYINFGQLLTHMQEFEQAEVFFKKALTIEPQTATAFYALGNLCYIQEKYSEAKEFFLQAIELGLKDSDVYYMVGLSMVNLDQKTLAIPYLLRATELDKKDEEKLFQYGLALAGESFIDEAKKVFQQVIQQNPGHSDAHYNLGVIFFYLEKFQKALSAFELALHKQPEHVLAAHGQAQVKKVLSDK